jgi:hypothetical protein
LKRPLLVPLILLVFSVAMAMASPGFLESDEITHFLKAREMLQDWTQVLDIWGRPACTGLFGLAAAVGGMWSTHGALLAARLFAVIVTAWVGLGSAALYRQLRENEPTEERGPFFTGGVGGQAWVWVLLYAQPLFLLNSFTVMTEMLLACAWVWAAVMLLRGRVVWAGVLIGLGGLARPEGWLAIAAWPILLILWRQVSRERVIRWGVIAASILASFVPMIAWWLAGVVAYHRVRWMIDFFPWQAKSPYGKTGLLFLGSSVVALALWMWVPVIVGMVAAWRRKNAKTLLVVVGPIAGFFLVHATLGSMGLMGSMSLPRYFVCVSPFIAVLAMGGLQAMARWLRHPRWLRKGVIFALLMPGLLLASVGQLPVPKSNDLRQLDIVITAFEQRVPRAQWSTQLIADNPYVFYRTGIRMDTPVHDRIFTADGVRDAPMGTYLMTDAELWGRENRPTKEDLLSWGYQLVVVPQVEPRFEWSMFGPALRQRMGVGLWVKGKAVSGRDR